MDPYGSLSGTGYQRVTATVQNAPSMSVYAPSAHLVGNSTHPPLFYRPPVYAPGAYLDEDVYTSYQQFNSLGGTTVSDHPEFPNSGYGTKTYEGTADYWLPSENMPSEYNRTPPRTAYSNQPVHYNSNVPDPNVHHSKPPRFGAHFGGAPRGRTFRGMGVLRPRKVGPMKPLESEEDPTIRRPPSTSLYCEMCKVGCMGPKAFADHQNGQRHKKRMAQIEALERLKQGSAGETLKANSSNIKISELRCELCDVCCTGAEAYSSHLSGKMHQKAVRLHRELGKPVPETDHPLVPTSLARAVDARTEHVEYEGMATASTTNGTKSAEEPTMKKVELSKLIGEEKKAVGAEFIQVIPGPGGKGFHYQCSLCECQFTNADAKELHLKGRRHRLQYKKKVDPNLVVERKSSNASSKKTPVRFDRPAEKSPTIPPLSSLSNLSWQCVSSSNDPTAFFHLQPPFPHTNFRGQVPGALSGSPVHHPTMMLENRYLSAKHSTIVPTELEAQAMKTAVTLCELSLKRISDTLFEEAKRECMEKQDSSTQSEPPGSQITAADFEEHRVLRGVVRVGPLGKSLLLRGDHRGQLVLVCSEWPTSEVVTFLKTELIKNLNKLDDQYEYEVEAIPLKGQLTVRIMRKVPESELKADESIADEWPVISISIQLTSTAASNKLTDNEDSNTTTTTVESGAVEAAAAAESADESSVTAGTALPTAPEQQSLSLGRQLFTQGERIPKDICFEALDAIEQAKWFQAALKPPLGLVARVLVDFMRANKVWMNVNQFGILALLSHLLNLEYDFDYRSAVRSQYPPFATQSPFGARMRIPFLPPPPPSPPGPGRLFRRFFEAIASGLLLQLCEEDLNNTECSLNSPADANVDEPDKHPVFFAYKLLATAPIGTREEITVSAQYCLRQLAFKQLYKVLRMEPLSSGHASKKETARNVPAAADTEVSEAAPVKRRRSDLDSVGSEQPDREPNEQVAIEGENHTEADRCPTPEASSSEPSSPQATEPATDAAKPEAAALNTTRPGTAPKRSRKGR